MVDIHYNPFHSGDVMGCITSINQLSPIWLCLNEHRVYLPKCFFQGEHDDIKFWVSLFSDKAKRHDGGET